MSFEKLKAEIGVLLTAMENQPQDQRELYEQVREKLNEMRAFGLPIPQDLADLEQSLEIALGAGRSGSWPKPS